MADITMCKGNRCPGRVLCVRYTARPCEYRQSYFVDSPIKNGHCESFWANVDLTVLKAATDFALAQRPTTTIEVNAAPRLGDSRDSDS